MIYVARLFSLMGGFLLPVGLVTIFMMSAIETKVPTFAYDYWGLTLATTGLALVLLAIGQILGSDIFKVTGKDSVFAIPEDNSDDETVALRRRRYYP